METLEIRKKELVVFAEYLKLIPPALVFKYLVENDAQRRILSASALESVAKDFASKGCIEKFEKLSDEAKRICVCIYFSGIEGIKVNEAIKQYHQELLTSFLVYAAQDKNKQMYYFGFQEIEHGLTGSFENYLSENIHNSISSKPVPFLKKRICTDLCIVLIYALNGILQKKKDGRLVKSSLMELMKVLHGTSETCLFLKKDTDLYEVVTFLISYGIARGYLFEEGRVYKTTHAIIKKYVSLPLETVYEDTIEFAYQSGKIWSKNIQQFIDMQTQNVWLSSEFFPDYFYDKAVKVLQILHYLGCIDTVSKDNVVYWRKALSVMDIQDSLMAQKITIQPDFSVIIPQEVKPQLLYAFSQVGVITRLDQVYKGFIREKSIHESMSENIEAQQLLLSLSSWHAPENVLLTVKEWIHAYARCSVISGEIIVTRDSKTSKQVFDFKPLHEMIESVDADRVFRIKKGKEKEVRDILVAMGFDPRVPHFAESHSVPSDAMFISHMLHTQKQKLSILTDFDEVAAQDEYMIKIGKYSEELKALDYTETIHVIEYAVLMGEQIRFDYEGDTTQRAGVYKLRPTQVVRSTEPYIEGKNPSNDTEKKYFIKKIKKIGVIRS